MAFSTACVLISRYAVEALDVYDVYVEHWLHVSVVLVGFVLLLLLQQSLWM